jgi:hypothetical protein
VVLLEGADAAGDLGLEPVDGLAQAGDVLAESSVGEAIDVFGRRKVENLAKLIDNCSGSIDSKHMFYFIPECAQTDAGTLLISGELRCRFRFRFRPIHRPVLR